MKKPSSVYRGSYNKTEPDLVTTHPPQGLMADNTRLPLQPKSLLRGHKAQVHAATFVRRNDRLVTGDAEGFVVVWDLTIMRPRAVWQAHSNAILGVAGWGDNRIITYGLLFPRAPTPPLPLGSKLRSERSVS